MESPLIVILSLVLLLQSQTVFCTSSTSARDECSEAYIQKCLAPLQNYQTDITQAVVPTMTVEEMKAHCRLYDGFRNCLRPVRSNCSVVNQLVYAGTDAAYDFMCKEAFDEYVNHRECFSNTDLHTEGDRCNETLNESLKQLGFYNHSVNYKRERVCQYADQYLGCVESVVFSFCGQEAATWQRTLDSKSLEPLLTNIGCPGYSYDFRKFEEQNRWIYIVIGVLLVVSVIIIVVSIVLIVRTRRQKRRRPRRPEDVPSVAIPDPPPAYNADTVNLNYLPHQGNATYMNGLPGAEGGSVQIANAAQNGQAGPLPNKAPISPPPYDSAQAPIPNYTATGGYGPAPSADSLKTDGGFVNPIAMTPNSLGASVDDNEYEYFTETVKNDDQQDGMHKVPLD